MSPALPKMLRRTAPAPQTGIVHLGLGAFFRAHGAIYLQEAMMQSGGNWGVVGVSLRSSGVRDKLAPQDCLYTALELSAQGMTPQVVDCITDVLVAPENPGAVLDVMAAETTRIVSLTVTEKGYYRGSANGALDTDHPDIRRDLNSETPKTAPGILVRALDLRRRRGLRPFTVLSLDNLPANGQLTRKIVCEFARRIDRELAHWIETECKFPCTMVDRIVPATTQGLIRRAEPALGYHDPALVAHEPFRQWVIEDNFVDGVRPPLEAAGAQLVTDVEPFEHMKLRMLNGSHSALAYLGCLAGHETVSDAIRDENIARFIDALWREEIAPSLKAPPNVDLQLYARHLKGRFMNREIRHLLDQIAMDGSQKLPQRVLAPLFENLAAGRPYHRLLTVVAAWMRFVQSRVMSGGATLADPLEPQLTRAVTRAADDRALVANLLGLRAVFADLRVDRIKQDLLAIIQRCGGFDSSACLAIPPVPND